MVEKVKAIPSKGVPHCVLCVIGQQEETKGGDQSPLSPTHHHPSWSKTKVSRLQLNMADVPCRVFWLKMEFTQVKVLLLSCVLVISLAWVDCWWTFQALSEALCDQLATVYLYSLLWQFNIHYSAIIKFKSHFFNKVASSLSLTLICILFLWNHLLVSFFTVSFNNSRGI